MERLAEVGPQLERLQLLLGGRLDSLPDGSGVVQIQVDDLLDGQQLAGWVETAARRVSGQAQLSVVFLFPTTEKLLKQRLPVMLATIDGLSQFTSMLNAEIVVAYQGDVVEELKSLVDRDICIHFNDQVALVNASEDVVVGYKDGGKTENLLKSLARFRAEGRDPKRTFVATVDDDYVVNDALNQALLAITWMLGKSAGLYGDTNLETASRNIEFVKSGGPRLVPAKELVDAVLETRLAPLTYLSLLHWIGEKGSPAVQIELASLGGVVTPLSLSTLLSDPAMNELSRLANATVTLGGRTVEFLSDLFFYRAERPLYDALSAFTCVQPVR